MTKIRKLQLFTALLLAGYALVHMKPKGSGLVVAALLVSLYFPVRVVSIISIYETQHWLGLINSTSGLILPYITCSMLGMSPRRSFLRRQRRAGLVSSPAPLERPMKKKKVTEIRYKSAMRL